MSQVKIDLNNLDKSNWKTYRFDEIAKNISERVDPNNTDLKIYIGLEHIDSESLHIKRHGTPDDVNGTKLKFYKGDIIFGRRRAYQRKAGIATWDGFCSAHALVLRANPDVIEPELFPFFMHSDLFMNRAIDISVGSLSPTINWGTLKHQEFLLPPKEIHSTLASLLLGNEEVLKSELHLKKKLQTSLEAEIEYKIHGEHLTGSTINQVIARISKRKETAKLAELGKFFKGKGISKSEVIENGVPCVRYGELYTKHHRIIRGYQSFINRESAKKAMLIMQHDILFAGSGETIQEIGKSAAVITSEEAYAGSDILVFRPHDMDGTYAGYLMNSKLVRYQLNKLGTGATVMHVYASDLEKIVVPKIDKVQQIEIALKLEVISKNITYLTQKIETLNRLNKSIINKVF
ncbi:restriction endonuclease subunit S [Photobacterium toruni]|uniref:restriction endonuclease subunit S n=1 Tax=Photobacterium toruni TaxID=1935446 RepID=UPI002E19DEA0|nr:restriction endonuclease subunit S [Photobacterium toruni]